MNISDIRPVNSSATSEYTVYQSNPGINIPKTSTTSGTTQAEKQLIQAIESANHWQTETTECEFSIHEETKEIMIKIIDTTTKEVIKEIPSEKILDMFATMCEVTGLFVDEKR
nr:flagellar protein FlaG [uncultured Cellulosilyticum sp.]